MRANPVFLSVLLFGAFWAGDSFSQSGGALKVLVKHCPVVHPSNAFIGPKDYIGIIDHEIFTWKETLKKWDRIVSAGEKTSSASPATFKKELQTNGIHRRIMEKVQDAKNGNAKGMKAIIGSLDKLGMSNCGNEIVYAMNDVIDIEKELQQKIDAALR